ncbi:MAG: long-chain fatty acid--CoA ligase [Desulfovibrio sp.]|nr:long-chain fatty acid--CoA ligase [Desulfovibrio sp.]
MSRDASCPWLSSYAKLDIPDDVPRFAKPLHVFIDEAARDYPDRPAVIFHNRRISYARLKEDAERFAFGLKELGIGKGDRIAVMLPNLPQALTAFWGVVKNGATLVMVNPLYMETELVGHLSDAGCTAMILLDRFWAKVAPLRDRLPVKTFIVTTVADALAFPLNLLAAAKDLLAGGKDRPAVAYGRNVVRWKAVAGARGRWSCPAGDPERDAVLLQYTGGTTGTPKGVMISHANLGTNAAQTLAFIHETRETPHCFIAVMPFFHVYGLSVCAVIPALLAAAVVPVPQYTPIDMLRLIARHKPTIFPGAPAIYNSLLQQKTLRDYDLTSIKLCISGSAPLARDILERFKQVTGASILEGYGLTEASPITHANPDGKDMRKENSIGMPIPGTLARIVDMERGEAVLPPGELGELVVKGPQVMLGYWNRPEETAQTVRDGWLYTGDLAYMDEEGYFFIMDRKKDLVLVGGYNVYPREVDEVLMAHPDIQDAVAVGIPDALKGESIKAYVVPRKGASLKKADVTAWCRARLASYKLPRSVEFRESLPKNIVGKVLRRMLRQEEMEKLQARRDKAAKEADASPRQGG